MQLTQASAPKEKACMMSVTHSDGFCGTRARQNRIPACPGDK